MATFVRTSNNSKTGYELVTVDEKGNEVVVPIDSQPKGEPFTLILPENESNRKYFSSKKVDAAGGKIELTYKESKTFGHRSESTTRKGLEEYLEGDDKATYLALVEKAKAAREAANKKAPMTEYEKKLRAVQRAQAALDALLAQQNA